VVQGTGKKSEVAEEQRREQERETPDPREQHLQQKEQGRVRHEKVGEEEAGKR